MRADVTQSFALAGIVMFKLPSRLRVVERRRVSGELELLHHFLRVGVFAFEEQRQINLELDQLRGAILVRSGSGGEERFETLARLWHTPSA